MKSLARLVFFCGVASVAGPSFAASATPPLNQVLEVLRTNLPELDEAELNRAAVAGLLAELRGRASMASTAADTNPALMSFAVLDRGVALARVGRVTPELARELTAGFQAATTTNKLEGLVLDLRFVAGDDFPAVVPIASLFVGDERPLLDWGNGMQKAAAESAALRVPLAVLINRETIGAAEGLAGVLREAGVALLIGNTTAGRARAGRNVELGDGFTLRVASTPVKLGDGSVIPDTGVTPDIAINIAIDQERALREKMFGPVSVSDSSTNTVATRPARSPRVNEADLVRERRNGTNQSQSPLPAEQRSAASAPRPAPAPKQVIVDPALARAVDLLKALTVIQRNRS
jgi:hypothetical protein